MAIIGYPSNSRTETAPGRHLIDQRRLLRGPGHIFTGCARFWLFNSRRVPDYHAPYPIMASNTRALRPTAHTRAIPGPCSQLSTTMAFFQIDSIQGSRLLVPLLLSLSHTQPTNRSHTQPRTRDHRSCDRPTMSDRTTKLTENSVTQTQRPCGPPWASSSHTTAARSPRARTVEESRRLTSAQGRKEAARHY